MEQGELSANLMACKDEAENSLESKPPVLIPKAKSTVGQPLPLRPIDSALPKAPPPKVNPLPRAKPPPLLLIESPRPSGPVTLQPPVKRPPLLPYARFREPRVSSNSEEEVPFIEGGNLKVGFESRRHEGSYSPWATISRASSPFVVLSIDTEGYAKGAVKRANG